MFNIYTKNNMWKIKNKFKYVFLFLTLILFNGFFINIVFGIDDAGIDISTECLSNWQCGMRTNELLNIRDSEPADTKIFIQDIILTATTFIWTVVVISLIVSWLMLIFAWADEKMAQKWKNWLKFSLIWLVIVLFSYVIIQVIQYVVRWW